MFRFFLVLVLLAAIVSAEVSAGSLYGTIHPRTIQGVRARSLQKKGDKSSPAPITTSARVSVLKHTLSGEETPNPVAVAITAVDGSFSLHNIPVGFYTLAVDGYNDLIFPSYQLEVLRTASGAVKCRVIDNERVPSPIRGGATPEDPVELESITVHSYFVPREEYSIWNFFKNPMLLMMLFTFGVMGLTQLMPKEEMRQSMKEMNEALENSKKVLGAKKD